MLKKKKYTYFGKIGALHLAMGGTLVLFMFFLSADYSARQLRCYCAAGALLMLLGIGELIRYRRERAARDMAFSEGFDVNGAAGSDPAVWEDPILTGFRKDYAAFFAEEGIRENSAIQSDTTQLFKNILDLQKKRLDRMGIRLEFRSIRKLYTEEGIRRDSFFDGKYEITDVDEEIEAKRRFTEGGRKIFLRTSNQVAHYTLLDAKQVGDSDRVICPNCGNVTARENLIDGCDYCGTRFSVEDLGRKISSFSFRDRYDIAYAKFKSLRSEYADNAILCGFILIYFLIVFCTLLVLSDEAGSGDVMNPIFATFSILGVGGCFALLFDTVWAVLYAVLLMPLMHIGASFKYNSKRKLRALQDAEAADKAFAERIRSTDPLFSAADLASNIQNKLACIIFAETAAQANAFSGTDLSSLLPGFKNVFDFDMNKVNFLDFRIADGLQQLELEVPLLLFGYDGKRVKELKKTVRMKLVRSADLRTRAICAPSVMKCVGCGQSLSLMNGLICSYCGTRVDLKNYDWVIAGFDLK